MHGARTQAQVHRSSISDPFKHRTDGAFGRIARFGWDVGVLPIEGKRGRWRWGEYSGRWRHRVRRAGADRMLGHRASFVCVLGGDRVIAVQENAVDASVTCTIRAADETIGIGFDARAR